jgi:hypothetical protein
MCDTAASQKIDLLARVESVLVGSVKMSECSPAARWAKNLRGGE